MVAAADVSIKISIIALSRENPDVFCVQILCAKLNA